MKQKRDSSLGSPPPHSFALQGCARKEAGSGVALYSSHGIPCCGVSLRSVTRSAVSRAVVAFTVCLVIVGCSHINELKSRSWIVTGGEYLNEPIAFDAPPGFQIADMNGNVHIYLDFHENGSTVLPGINSDPLYGQWRADWNIVTLALDTAKYEHIRSSAAPRARFNTAMADSTFTTEPDTSEVDDPIGTGQYNEVMKIYRNPFIVDIDGDKLVMRSSTTTIRAMMDHTVDKLFEGL